jgi:hypothetical protein
MLVGLSPGGVNEDRIRVMLAFHSVSQSGFSNPSGFEQRNNDLVDPDADLVSKCGGLCVSS